LPLEGWSSSGVALADAGAEADACADRGPAGADDPDADGAAEPAADTTGLGSAHAPSSASTAGIPAHPPRLAAPETDIRTR
jgi:hypothetical protein